MTTYLADYGINSDDPDTAREMRLFWLRDYAALPATRDAPVANFTAKFHNADQVIGYNKAAFLFHMLRSELGDTAFASALPAFWRDHRFGVADWDGLRRSFERASNRDLGDFFVLWLQHAGAPRLPVVGRAYRGRWK
ncbi:MAG: hypothetical protein OES26_26240 [Gammaproteobacteria bacterium]|nr:hypothetical protein [Gammaproteobacteria bacterium]